MRNWAVSALALLLACSASPVRNGAAQRVGGGKAWAWTERDEKGKPARIGITMNTAVFSTPPDSYQEVELPLPGRNDVLPYEHVVLGWDPMGHNPAAYSVPHFDFLFYFVPAESVGVFTPGRDSAPVPDQFRVPGYSVLLEEPAAGVHWGDTTAAEMHGRQFTATFVYGFSRGRMSFLEPMVARDFLQATPGFEAQIKQPAMVPLSGYYPTGYSVRYNPKDSSVTVALEGLTFRGAQ